MRLYLNHRSLKQSLDNTKLQLNQKQHALNELASVDQLTGTSNRKAITTFLSEFHKQPHADGEFIALAILDIDYFQRINDALGYFAGDAVLKEVASRIEGELRDEDRVGRMNANHFAIVLCDLIAPKTAENIIHRIQSVIAQPIIFNDTDINVTCSVGAAVQEVETLDIAELFKLSEQALLQAKRNQRGSIFLFSEHAQYALSRQRQIINLLRERDFDDLFQLAYQPIVAISDRSVVGCECLLR
jgi:diguanylate cyclase (GGDEF)-like protein